MGTDIYRYRRLWFGANLRDTLPVSRSNFRPPERIMAKQRLTEVQLERQHQEQVKDIKANLFRLGQVVHLQGPHSKGWNKQVTIIGPVRNERELQLRESETGRVFFRNRIFLRPVYNNKQEQDTDIRKVEQKNGQDLKGIIVEPGRPKRKIQLPLRFRD